MSTATATHNIVPAVVELNEAIAEVLEADDKADSDTVRRILLEKYESWYIPERRVKKFVKRQKKHGRDGWRSDDDTTAASSTVSAGISITKRAVKYVRKGFMSSSSSKSKSLSTNNKSGSTVSDTSAGNGTNPENVVNILDAATSLVEEHKHEHDNCDCMLIEKYDNATEATSIITEPRPDSPQDDDNGDDGDDGNNNNDETGSTGSMPVLAGEDLLPPESPPTNPETHKHETVTATPPATQRRSCGAGDDGAHQQVPTTVEVTTDPRNNHFSAVSPMAGECAVVAASADASRVCAELGIQANAINFGDDETRVKKYENKKIAKAEHANPQTQSASADADCCNAVAIDPNGITELGVKGQSPGLCVKPCEGCVIL